MGKFLSFIISLILVAGTTSCSSNGCSENQSSIPLAGFYSIETGEKIAMNAIEISGVGAESLLTSGNEPVQQTYLPLRSSQTSAAFCFHYNDFGDDAAYNDTVWIEYTSTPYFASEECGAMFQYEIKSISHTNIIIDSVAVIDPIVNNIDVERIKIFFKTN